MEPIQEFTLTFRGRSPQQVNEIATKLKTRAAEMGGFVGMVFSPPIRPDEPVRDEAASPITRFGRVFGGG